ncbi:hypothetical protein COS83_01895 [archaeon CG07_land_8_20_14_0_80_38_8]|nr:MAG: hypothetical protein COS83_01895 [archaeon CG07_land_8_20_14_0_80_38_8]PIU89496.1 MAG: hypothetical protein COS64_00205 [archaeon CG06_land_8_20_14_3_00_37_11]
MGVKQVIVKGLDNLEASIFKSVFKGLSNGIVEVLNDDSYDELDYYELISPNPQDYNVLILNRHQENFACIKPENKFIYFSIPKNLCKEDSEKLVKNYYLLLISDAFLPKNENNKHKTNNCVNSANFYFNESLESMDKKLLEKNELCIDCHRMLDLDVKDNLINELIFPPSKYCACSSQSAP